MLRIRNKKLSWGYFAKTSVTRKRIKRSAHKTDRQILKRILRRRLDTLCNL